MDFIKGILDSVNNCIPLGKIFPALKSGMEAVGDWTGRLLYSICCALFGFPILAVVAMIILGWNEKRSVCAQKAVIAGLANIVEIDCAMAGDGSLVHFRQCALSQDGIVAGSLMANDLGQFTTMLSTYAGTGLKVKAEMFQCIQTAKKQNNKTVYTYSTGWREQPIDSSNFNSVGTNRDASCGVAAQNPSWPSDVPKTATAYAPSVKVGAFTIKDSVVKEIPLTKSLKDRTPPSGWSANGDYFENPNGANSKNIGKMRVTFMGTNWDAKLSGIGFNNKGTIEAWTAPDDWLCSGFKLTAHIQASSIDIDKHFSDLQSAYATSTWVFRVLGFAIMWFAFCLCCGPCDVATDCIPYFGDLVDYILYAIACLPGTACCLFVVGIVWSAMRPYVGIPMIIFFFIMAGAVAFYRIRKQTAEEEKKLSDVEEGGAGELEYKGPVEQAVAVKFVKALRAEFVDGEEGAVGAIVDSDEGLANTLAPYEDRVRDANDRGKEIEIICEEWGVPADSE